MVSALWKACSQGDLDAVNTALAAQNVDLEIKDHTGSTPLIEAIKNGHTEVVKVLLDKGADPTNASSQGLPETFTSDQGILGMLNFARSKHSQDTAAPQENGYEANDTSAYAPPANYPFYPSINGAPPPDMFYAPPMVNGHRPSNMPPPEVTGRIPCRYYPACRYGAACAYQHPPAQYYPGQHPAPFTSYDQMPQQPYAPTYYPVSPPSFPPPPPLQMAPSSEMPPQGHFSPTGAPVPMPYGPMSPVMYSHPGPIGLPPLPAGPTPQSPPFNPSSPPASHPNGHVGPFPPSNGPIYPDAARSPQLNPQPDAAVSRGPDGARRGGLRRGSFVRAKQPPPPCIFYPMGRCKNGDECRFPHIMPQDGVPPPAPFHSRGGAPRPRASINGNGYAALDEKMAHLSLNGHSGSLRGRGGRPNANGHVGKRAPIPMKQRVPNADEFPVLGGGSTTPPTRVNGGFVNGNGPTAAQVLQAPRPFRTNASSQAATPRNISPERVPETNGVPASESLPLSFASVATASTDVTVSA
ncbi:Glycerol-3-phosphate dehydrogenase [NAD(+)] [Mycena chlorophos]|uniref:Glycerol-3-phosphate dehydrogenase [NAD(+)] n=1 Tax=Mycena chlorophos TaxID=658473 RepID=A0A8H6T3M4_MYCCL|nr:Glycerol-3-phosphate dehydrogenase [NAD(+)] [Mycena chlorophos]